MAAVTVANVEFTTVPAKSWESDSWLDLILSPVPGEQLLTISAPRGLGDSLGFLQQAMLCTDDPWLS